MQIAGSRALVTGGSRGIGAAIARELVAAGASVALVARSAQTLEALASELGGEAYTADLSDPVQVRQLVERVETGSGPVDILVNNAGAEMASNVLDARPEDIEHVFSLNTVAPAVLASAAARRMVERGRGHIVNISSLAGVAALPGLAAYSASKAALTHFTAGLRADLRGTPVGTTVVELGPVDTDMYGRVGDYGPAAKAFRRMLQLQVISTVSPELVARRVVEAVEAGRRHVRIPQRAALFSMIQEVPRRMTEHMLVGLPTRP